MIIDEKSWPPSHAPPPGATPEKFFLEGEGKKERVSFSASAAAAVALEKHNKKTQLTLLDDGDLDRGVLGQLVGAREARGAGADDDDVALGVVVEVLF